MTFHAAYAVRRRHETQRRRKAFTLGIAGRAVDDHGYDPVAPAQGLELAHLFIDIMARRRRRADHDQKRRERQRRLGLFAQRPAGGKILTVAEHGPQRLRHRTHGRLDADQILVDLEVFQRAVQSLRLTRVGVAVRQERPVAPMLDLRHRRTASGPASDAS